MQSKSLLIAIAAFAVTTTGAYAYGGPKLLNRAGLSDDQVSAIEEAQELKAAGDYTAARDTLIEAGITERHLRSMHREGVKSKGAMQEAVENGDYEAFREAIADSPLADIITTKADFEQFQEAHELRQSGELEEARNLMEDLGLPVLHHQHRHGHFGHNLIDLTDEQRDALRAARQANDIDTVHAILDEAGVGYGPQRDS